MKDRAHRRSASGDSDNFDKLPCFAAVICTRHRPASTIAAILSLLASRPAAALIIVVDQADPDRPDPLAEFEGLANFTRIRQKSHGLSLARNVAIATAAAAGVQFVAFTDDDCVAEPTWLRGFDDAFSTSPDIAAVFGSVVAGPYDRSRGIIPAYEVTSAVVLRGLGDKPRAEGMGACMAIRVDAWRLLDGFDEWLGAGSCFAAAEDSDMVLRLLHSGFAVAESPSARVIHHGFRAWPEARFLVAAYMRGYGAVHAKMIRLAGFGALMPLMTVARRWLTGRPAIDLNHLPSRRLRLRAFAGGAAQGFCLRLAAKSGRFLPLNMMN